MTRLMQLLLLLTVTAGGLGAGAYFTRDRWGRLFWPEAKGSAHDHAHGDRVKLSAQARKNLGLVVGPVELRTSHWRTVTMPGSVVDRPGQSDRGVTAPMAGVVTRVHAFPSDLVKPGDALFDLRITSEFVQNALADLFRTVNEEQLQAKVVKRLIDSGGAVAEGQVVEAKAQQVKLAGQVRSYRQILQSSGLTTAQIDAAAAGKPVRDVTVIAPPLDGTYEVQELKTHLGEQVQAGRVLGVLADHRLLYVEGRAFRSEAGLLAKAAESGWPVEPEFNGDDAGVWPPLSQTLTIRHLANEMDPDSRTFGFYVPLVNQSRTFERDGKSFLVWRFRPGQRVRLRVPVEPLRDVIVLPAAAVVREGPEAYVFRANGDALDRKPVTLLYEDRHEAVLANDGSLPPGLFVAMNAAAALNRQLKAQQAGGEGHDHHHH